jgi:uncharacterized protein YlxW (UPF0749 family)
MPLFTKSFSKRKPTKPRNRLSSAPKLDESIDDFRNVKIKFDDEKFVKFVEGVWMSSKKSPAVDDEEVLKLVKHNKKLEEEKNMLNAKLEICLDLLTETVAEKEAIEKRLK